MGVLEATGLFLATLYVFLGLGVICDEWFVPSLEIISESLNLSADVAGATFLAAGSSAPELFTSVADTFGPSNSIGIGTIVGSAMFNILIIVALSAAATKKILNIDWRPVVRDCSFYVASIALLALFFQDGMVHWYEALVLLLTYGLYILFMVFNERIFALCRDARVVPVHESDGTTVTTVEDYDEKPQLDAAAGVVPSQPSQPSAEEQKEEGEGEEEKEEEEEGYFARFQFPWDDSIQDKCLWLLSLPYYVVFTLSVPDCSKPAAQRLFVVTFVMSICWIGVLCFVMVMTASYMGCIVDLGPVVMGQLVLAIGTSVPDALGSMLVAKAGEADMAIANAIGSNVFDILLGLGLPWCLKALSSGEPVPVNKCGVELAVILLFLTVFVFFGVLIINRWKMNNRLGISFLVAYGLYFSYTFLTAKRVLPAIHISGC